MGISLGLFDSGHGGLDILRSLRKKGDFDLSYIADLKFHPYGKKSVDEIVERSLSLCKTLLGEKDCDLIVVACNTATAHAIDELRKTFDVPFVGVEPYLNYINKVPKDHLKKGEVGALVTPNTLNSLRFERLKELRDPDDLISVLAFEELAPLVETYLHDFDDQTLKKALEKIFHSYLPLGWKETILGCTHYPLIQNFLEDLLKTTCVSPTPQVVEQVFRVLEWAPKESLREDFDYWNTQESNWRKASLRDFFK